MSRTSKVLNYLKNMLTFKGTRRANYIKKCRKNINDPVCSSKFNDVDARQKYLKKFEGKGFLKNMWTSTPISRKAIGRAGSYEPRYKFEEYNFEEEKEDEFHTPISTFPKSPKSAKSARSSHSHGGRSRRA